MATVTKTTAEATIGQYHYRFSRLLRAPSRRSTSVSVLEHASLGLPSLGALATPAKQTLRG